MEVWNFPVPLLFGVIDHHEMVLSGVGVTQRNYITDFAVGKGN